MPATAGRRLAGSYGCPVGHRCPGAAAGQPAGQRRCWRASPPPRKDRRASGPWVRSSRWRSGRARSSAWRPGWPRWPAPVSGPAGPPPMPPPAGRLRAVGRGVRAEQTLVWTVVRLVRAIVRWRLAVTAGASRGVREQPGDLADQTPLIGVRQPPGDLAQRDPGDLNNLDVRVAELPGDGEEQVVMHCLVDAPAVGDEPEVDHT